MDIGVAECLTKKSGSKWVAKVVRDKFKITLEGISVLVFLRLGQIGLENWLLKMLKGMPLSNTPC